MVNLTDRIIRVSNRDQKTAEAAQLENLVQRQLLYGQMDQYEHSPSWHYLKPQRAGIAMQSGD